MVLELISASALFVFLLAAAGGVLDPLVLSVGSLLAILIGFGILDVQRGVPGDTSVLVFLGIVAFALGYLILLRILPARTGRFGVSTVTLAAAWLLSSVVIGLAVFHFMVSGIPILSANVEVKRFDFSSSGLLGIPGRMYLFGVPFVAFMNSFLAQSGRRSARFLAVITWLALLAFQLGAGFKGGLVVALALFLYSLSFQKRPLRVLELFTPRYVGLIVAGIVFAVVVSFKYTSVGVTSAGQSLTYLSDRATVIAAEPGYVAVTKFAGHGGPPYLLSDATYFLAKYSGLRLNPYRAYPLELYVSSTISKTPLTPGAFIVSVTIGLFSELVVDFGVAASIFLMILAGCFFAYLVWSAQGARSTFAAAVCALSAYEFAVVMSNGNAVYYFINVLAVVGFLTLVYGVCWSLAWVMVSGAKASSRARFDNLEAQQ